MKVIQIKKCNSVFLGYSLFKISIVLAKAPKINVIRDILSANILLAHMEINRLIPPTTRKLLPILTLSNM